MDLDIIAFNLNYIMQLKQFYNIANKGSSRKKCYYFWWFTWLMMFSPCVFVCVYVCHGVCPDDLAMKDWCHTNYILKVYSWKCLFVQVVFHALATSLMTSPGHTEGKMLKFLYQRQYFIYRVNQILKISEMLMAMWLVYSTSGITSGKKGCRDLKMAATLKISKY